MKDLPRTAEIDYSKHTMVLYPTLGAFLVRGGKDLVAGRKLPGQRMDDPGNTVERRQVFVAQIAVFDEPHNEPAQCPR